MGRQREDSDESSSDTNLEGVWAAAGFAVVLIVVGLPIWWYTTTVYRANLPYSTIDSLSSQITYQTVHLRLVGERFYVHEDQIKNNLEDQDPLLRFSISSRSFTSDEQQWIKASKTLVDLDNTAPNRKIIASGSLVVYFLKESDALFEETSLYISTKRMIIVKESVDIAELVKIISSMVFDPHAKEKLLVRGHKELPQNKELLRQSMKQVPTEPGYDVTLTLMLPQPHKIITRWNAQKSIQEYLGPFVQQVSHILDLHIRSQVLYMNTLRVNPTWSKSGKYYSLPEHQLPLTINHIEPKLGSFVSTRPALHFLIYVPTDDQTPLQIVDSIGKPLKSNSFLVPRWGGVLIHNPPKISDSAVKNKTSAPVHFELDDRLVMQTIVSQIYKLLPVPNPVGDLAIEVSQRNNGLLADWQLDSIARARLLDYLTNIKITLQSLCELVGEISNMVVSDEVSAWVMSAVDLWDDCLQAAREGRLKEATKSCTQSFSHSDAAFFHPSMLALLYFPDNQKYAIYVPLFLPVSIPVILSLKMIFKLIRGKNEKSKEE